MGSISFLPILYGAVLVCWFLYNYNLRKKRRNWYTVFSLLLLKMKQIWLVVQGKQ